LNNPTAQNVETQIAKDTVRNNFSLNEYMCSYALLSFLDGLDNKDHAIDGYIELSSLKAYAEKIYQNKDFALKENKRFNTFLRNCLQVAETTVSKCGEQGFFSQKGIEELKRLIAK
jgi:hypothetical protein